tara:strand:- start:1482 stop:1769 length:288 start_codon:yes stop_codon:yes gene_type:complete
MIIKVLGILDIFVGMCFWLFGIFHIIPDSFILLLGLFLLVKGVIFVFTLNIVSVLDIISAVVIIAASASEIVMPNLVVIIVTLFLLQKGIFSMFG